MKQILCLFALCFACIGQNVFALSFTEALDNLSSFEKEIVRVDKLEKQRLTEIRQALIDIQNESDIKIRELDSELKTKNERLNALLEQPTSADLNEGGVEQNAVVDEILMRNTEELKLNLIVLSSEHKKASLVNVYANELLVQISELTSKQSQKLLFDKAPSLLSWKNWKTAYQSIPEMKQRISSDILTWIATVLAVGFVLSLIHI